MSIGFNFLYKLYHIGNMFSRLANNIRSNYIKTVNIIKKCVCIKLRYFHHTFMLFFRRSKHFIITVIAITA